MIRKRTVAVLGNLIAMTVAIMSWVVLAGCTSPGMRLLTMDVHQDDQLVLRTTFAAPDREGPADFWRRAGTEPFASDEQVASVEANKDNPLRAKLTGAVQIRIVHVDRLMTSASLTDLELVRNSADSPRWYLPEKEVQRAKQASGL